MCVNNQIKYGSVPQRSVRGRNTLIQGPSAVARWQWKLANRRPLRHGELSCPWRSRRSAILEFDPSSSCSWSLNRAVLETGGNMVSRTKERALDPLLVPALLALATPSIC